MGRKKSSSGLSSLVRAEEQAEEEILETPALSGFGQAQSDHSDSENEDLDAEQEAEIERQLVEEKLQAEQNALAKPKGVDNREALKAIVAEWDQGKAPLKWVETLDVCVVPLDAVSVHDDLKREVAFYNQTLASVRLAKERLKRENIAYKRPVDYFAEMLKSDAHMAKVKDKLIYEQKKITAVEERKKSQAHRKVAKELQAEKVKQRQLQKKDTLEAVKQWKKRKSNDKSGGGGGDEDESQLDAIINGGEGNKRKRGAQDDGRDGKKPRINHKRESKDKKFGFGGKKKYAKSNTKDSTNDFSQFPGRRGAAGKGGFKGKPAAAVRAAAAKNAGKGGKRAGKEQRSNQRAKGRR